MVEEETAKMVQLINLGTDRDLVKHLNSMTPEVLHSVVAHLTKDGETVLHLAAVRERVEGVSVMLRNKVDINARNGYGHRSVGQLIIQLV